MSLVVAGFVKDGVVVPHVPLPEGAFVEVHVISGPIEVPPDLQRNSTPGSWPARTPWNWSNGLPPRANQTNRSNPRASRLTPGNHGPAGPPPGNHRARAARGCPRRGHRRLAGTTCFRRCARNGAGRGFE